MKEMKKKIICIGIIIIFLLTGVMSTSAIKIEKQNKQELIVESVCSLTGHIVGYLYSDPSEGESVPLVGIQVKLRGINAPFWHREDLELTMSTDEIGFFHFSLDYEYFCAQYHIETENIEYEGKSYAKIYKFLTISSDESNSLMKNLGTIYMPEGINNNIAPSKPNIHGSTRIVRGERYPYTLSATDEDGDKLEYIVLRRDSNCCVSYNWGHPLCNNDGEGYDSGEETQTFTFEFNNVFGPKEIKVYVRDSKGAISECGLLPISFSKEKSRYLTNLHLPDLVENLLLKFPLFRHFPNLPAFQ